MIKTEWFHKLMNVVIPGDLLFELAKIPRTLLLSALLLVPVITPDKKDTRDNSSF